MALPAVNALMDHLYGETYPLRSLCMRCLQSCILCNLFSQYEQKLSEFCSLDELFNFCKAFFFALSYSLIFMQQEMREGLQKRSVARLNQDTPDPSQLLLYLLKNTVMK